MKNYDELKVEIEAIQQKIVEAKTVQELLDELGIGEKVMATAVNMSIVKKENWSSFKLREDDKIEFLEFVGGG